MKKAIRYLRISKEKQSNFSISGQDNFTQQYCDRKEIEVVATFIDEGYSAQNFDRPDFTKLESFLAQYHRTVDFLVVNSFDRFSRDTGEALIRIKMLQNKYNINIVSVSEGITFDKNDPGSFFHTGLLLLKGEDELIRLRSRVNLGIYTAKKTFGRYIGRAPYGYKNAKDEIGKPKLEIVEDRARIVRFIFEAYQSGAPFYIITADARKMGMPIESKSTIPRLLANPTYASYLMVKGINGLPSEMVEASHTPIIDKFTWNSVQKKLTRTHVPKMIINDNLPLRGVVSCWCGRKLTGAKSKGKIYWYDYYKCNAGSKHNNISAIKAHGKLDEIFAHLSLPDHITQAIAEKVNKNLEERLVEDKKQLAARRSELTQTETQLKSVESKFIQDLMNFETYSRWQSELNQKRTNLQAIIENLSHSESSVWKLFDQELPRLGDMKAIYHSASTLQKQSLVNQVFDYSLHIREGIYRTPSLMQIFSHNEVILNEKGLLKIEKGTPDLTEVPLGAGKATSIEHLVKFLRFIQQIKTA